MPLYMGQAFADTARRVLQGMTLVLKSISAHVNSPCSSVVIFVVDVAHDDPVAPPKMLSKNVLIAATATHCFDLMQGRGLPQSRAGHIVSSTDPISCQRTTYSLEQPRTACCDEKLCGLRSCGQDSCILQIQRTPTCDHDLVRLLSSGPNVGKQLARLA